MREISAICISIIAIAGLAMAQNMPPVVTAGPDSTIRIGYEFRMKGTVTDDGLPDSTLVINWTQLSGPDSGLVLLALFAPRSLTQVKKAGVYEMELSATDGEYTKTDTVIITVLDSLPFAIVTPEAGDVIYYDSTITVSWTIDPPYATTIDISTNGGINWKYLDGPIQMGDTAFEWTLADTIPESDDCFIKVMKYGHQEINCKVGPLKLTSTGVRHSVMRMPSSRNQGDFAIYTLNGRAIAPAIRLVNSRIQTDAVPGVFILRTEHAGNAAMHKKAAMP